jgi:hypothetical protein
MPGLTEHLKFNDKTGEVRMLKILTEGFSHQDYWSQVEELVQDYTKVHPMEMEIVVRQNEQKKAGAFTKWGEAKGDSRSEIKLGLSMPLMLMALLESYDPEILTDHKKSHLFRQKYKGLCTYAGK